MGPDELGDLIERCIQGDAEAQARFCAQYMDFVHKAVARKLSRLGANPALRAEVEDISHEVFERLLADNCQAMRHLRRPQSLQAWLMVTAQNRAVDYLRKWSSRLRAQQNCVAESHNTSYVPSPEEKLVSDERHAVLSKYLEVLSPRDYLILELFFAQKLKYAEIAEVLGLNINTVSARLRRAKAKLRHLLEEDRDELPPPQSYW